MYELPEDGTDVPKHVGVVEDYSDWFLFVFFSEYFNQNAWEKNKFKRLASCTLYVQGGSNMTGTDLCVNKCKQSRSYLNHLVPTNAIRQLNGGLSQCA